MAGVDPIEPLSPIPLAPSGLTQVAVSMWTTSKLGNSDAAGNPVTSNLAEYAFPAASEFPSFEVVHMETATWVNPLGAKGIGESGSIGSTPAIQSAVVDALSHLGVKHVEMPATPERVWNAINAA